jgi:hypothetical protein
MIVLYPGLALLCGFVAGFLTCWMIARSAALEIAAPPNLSHLVTSLWTVKLDAPSGSFPRQERVDIERVMMPRRLWPPAL